MERPPFSVWDYRLDPVRNLSRRVLEPVSPDHLGDEGGYQTNPLDLKVLIGSVSLSLLTVGLAFFGRGWPGFTLIIVGLLLLLLSVFGFVSNHV